jgi:hypothetical protein
MSDYNPDPRSHPDRYGLHNRYDYTLEPSGSGERSTYALVGMLAVIALIGGVLFFANPNPADQQQAQQPAPTQQTPAATPTPAPANPRQ